MKNIIIKIGAYVFGSIALFAAGVLIATPHPIQYGWQPGDTLHVVIFASSIVALKLMWLIQSRRS